MATNLALDDELIRTAQELGCHKTKKAAVTAALEAYVREHRLKELLELIREGGVEYDEDYDIAYERRRWTEAIERRQSEWDE